MFLIQLQISIAAESISREIKWNGIQENSLYNDQKFKFLNFEQAFYDSENEFLPYYYERVKIGSNVSITWTISNPAFKDLTLEEIEILNKHMIGNEIQIKSSIGIEKKQFHAIVSFIPIRKKNGSTGGYERLVTFDLLLNKNPVNTASFKKSIKKSFVASSVLKSGDWYKIKVIDNGVYKLDYEFFKSLQIDMNTLDPRDIRIYGYGGGMLPKANSASRIDDLVENSIYVVGESDGTFDKMDYLLFYGQGPTNWRLDSVDQRFKHTNHLYSDESYYFVTTTLGIAKRIDTIKSSILVPTHYVAEFDDYAVTENDWNNLLRSGSEWFGEMFDINTYYNFSYNFPNAVTSSNAWIKTDVIARSKVQSSFELTINSVPAQNIVVDKVGSTLSAPYVEQSEIEYLFSPTNLLNVGLQYDKPNTSSIGWLNYIEINIRRYLIMDGDQMHFRDKESVGSGNIAEYTLSDIDSSYSVWDISDPHNVMLQGGNLVDGNYVFHSTADNLKEYIVFNNKIFLTPVYVGQVQNQNLHGHSLKDMVIVTHPSLISEAQRLAEFHKSNDGLSVEITTTEQIFNEFSSGNQDVAAIRDYMRMYYERSNGSSPRYLLLFGVGSYDNKNRIAGNINLVPTYQSVLSTKVSHY